MSRYLLSKDKFQSLRGKVVVITGGSNGIGAATVELLNKQGARVVFGDVQSAEGEELAKRLSGDVLFQKTDVTQYEDLVSLFDTALKTYGRVDCAISNAGTNETTNFMNPDLSLEEIKQPPNTRTLDVNLRGSIFFTRIAIVYLQQGYVAGDDKSIILLSSVAGFKETPGIPVYTATKHGVLGLMRSLRMDLPQRDIRINAICPWFVATAMTDGIVEQWRATGLPTNEPPGVADIIVGVAVERNMHGKALYVEGNRAWEFEDNLEKLEPQIIGEEQARTLNEGQVVLGSGKFWQK